MVNTRGIQKHAHSPGDGNASKPKVPKTDAVQSGPTGVLQSERQSSPLSSASDTTRASNNLRRVLLLAFALSKSNLVNLALADPSEFSVVSEQLIHGLPYPQSFFLIGSVVYSDLFGEDTTKQICMEPLDLSFPRVAAILGHVFGTAPGGALLFNGYRGGMSFQSWMKSDSNRNVCSCAVNGKRHGPGTYHSCCILNQLTSSLTAIRAWDEPVPVFDCRVGFRLSQYHLNAKCHADPDEGDVILIICTVGRYRNLSYNVMSLNVQVVLKIADSPTVTDRDKPVHPLPSWFYELHSFGVSGEEPAVVVDEGDVEYNLEEVVY
ncbi:hypothetical protein EV421DRAFT_1911709 [Armillaria borealis]|uniref:Uncharacterized protein n=1 Tax=Armillaria borealis TaxID=47425 RepID=A0AA39IW67_9AGAR|nr:hypothetical protein EV421DRAFT_1911709 [Armillaria borealis]